MKKESSFKMKGFPGFGNESPVKKFDPNASDFHHAKQFDFSKSGRITNVRRPGTPRVSTKPASTFDKSLGNAKNAAKQQRKVARKAIGKVGSKIGAKFLGPVGAGLAIKDAIGTYKDIKKGMKPGKAARKNFLGF
jgi:hypothetical protein